MVCPETLAQNERLCHRHMRMKLTITTHEEQAQQDRLYWQSRTPEERLDAVERLRIEAGKFLYDYPSRLRRVVAITRRARG